MIDGMSRADYLFELGKARSLSGDFLNSIRLLEEASSLHLQQKQHFKYMECLSCLFWIYREQKDFKKIAELKEQLMELTWAENMQIAPRVHYNLGQCFLIKEDLKSAVEEFEKSLYQTTILKEKAQKEDSPTLTLKAEIERAFPLYGMASFHVKNGDVKSARDALAKVTEILDSFKNKNPEGDESVKRVLTETADLRERLELACQILKVNFFWMESRYMDAENWLWRCYEKVKKSKNLHTVVIFFYYLGANYMRMQDYNQAAIFLNLAKKSIDKDNFKYLDTLVSDCSAKLTSVSAQDYDLIVNLSTNSIIERHKGLVDFKNQFILLDLLKMFLSHPGQSHTKEEMVEQVWKQKYDPTVHDNKIYVTIKRLRELVEPDCRKPRYIFRGKDGYYLSSKMKVLLKHHQPQPQKEVLL